MSVSFTDCKRMSTRLNLRGSEKIREKSLRTRYGETESPNCFWQASIFDAQQEKRFGGSA